MDKNHLTDKNEPPQTQIPQELLDEITNLKKQNANSTFQLLKTQKVIADFENKIEELEEKINALKIHKEENGEVDMVLRKLNDLKRFL